MQNTKKTTDKKAEKNITRFFFLKERTDITILSILLSSSFLRKQKINFSILLLKNMDGLHK